MDSDIKNIRTLGVLWFRLTFLHAIPFHLLNVISSEMHALNAFLGPLLALLDLIFCQTITLLGALGTFAIFWYTGETFLISGRGKRLADIGEIS
jgi:hypothetical protein